MLGRLFSSATGHGRSPSSLESATEEQYTRNLLFSDATLSSSLPWQTPATGTRSGNFDDYNGFTVDGKDLRILLAQEDQERPSILFDTNILRSRGGNASDSQNPTASSSIRHERMSSSAALSKFSFGSQPDTTNSTSLKSPTGAFQTRSRGSTTSTSQSSPPTPSSLRDAESKDIDLLECMFGASSSTKSGTRLHVLKSSEKLPRVPSSPLVSASTGSSRSVRKPPLVRAQTSSLPSTKTMHGACDTVLITRIFTVAPPEVEKESLGVVSKPTPTLTEESNDTPERAKPPKLREKKTPAYAVSLVIQLPRQEFPRPLSLHGPQRDGQSPPASSSFGSDLQSSWTFLDALPPSLSTPRSNHQSSVDGNIDFVLRRWDAAVRHLSILELIAKDKIFTLLSQVDDISSGRKTPKEKRMQRINQKIIRLPAFALVNDQELCKKSFQAINLVRDALSTPSVRPLPGGHWLEEARIVARACSQKGNERFLVTLLSAFLGNHFEWINEIGIGRELHGQRLLLKWKSQQDKPAVRSRTIIVCEDRILARRLVFLLASFLFPGMLSLRSFSSHIVHQSSTLPQHEQKSTGGAHFRDSGLSTSASSSEEDSRGGHTPRTARRRLQRNASETNSMKTAHLSIPHQDSSFQKSSAGTTTTVTPNASTPLAYVTSMPPDSGSYFPAVPGATGSGSAAAASLQRLRRSSSSASSMPSTWGSILGSIWSTKHTSSAGSSNTTVPSDGQASTSTSSRMSHYQGPVNQLEIMAQEVGTTDSPVQNRHAVLLLSPEEPKQDVPPRLEVNEKDGVVDVDLNLPKSLLHSYASSPDVLPAFPTPMSTSTASLDDSRSFFSVTSTRAATDHINNIAGYLKQYHPDFVLQAARSCSEKDIRESMADSDFAGTSSGSSYEECNTLIADARNYSVKRLTLRRHIRKSEKEPSKEQQSTLRDEFSLEPITAYDETLAAAIDRALDGQSAMPSRLPSPSPSKSRHFRTVSTSTTSTVNAPSPLATSFTPSSTKETLQPVPIPQRNRGQFIIDALKEVVGEVDRELHSSKRSENIPMGAESNPSISKPQTIEENVLREGVKRWLQGAEETSVW